MICNINSDGTFTCLGSIVVDPIQFYAEEVLGLEGCEISSSVIYDKEQRVSLICGDTMIEVHVIYSLKAIVIDNIN